VDPHVHEPTHDGGRESPPSVGALIGGIVSDVEVLLRQEFALASQEIRDEVQDTAGSVVGLVAIAAMVATGVVLLGAGGGLALAEWLQQPAWVGLLVAGGILAAVGILVVVVGLRLRKRQQKRTESTGWLSKSSSSDNR